MRWGQAEGGEGCLGVGTISEEVLTKVQLEGDIAKPEPQSCNVSHVDNGRSVEVDKAHSGHSN